LSTLDYSVIIISFNGFEENTGPCLHALLGENSCFNVEVILLDNASTDGSREKVKALEGTDPRLSIILNQENRGFSGGNNDAFRRSLGKRIVFLNSDTITHWNALDQLILEMDEDPSIKMLGPVSNAVAGAQKIQCSKEEELALSYGKDWMKAASSLPPFPTSSLSFFCIAVDAELYRTLDGLDESFKMGYFEDTDFSFRARNINIMPYCTEKVFVYHKGGGSFEKLGPEPPFIAANKNLFKKRHGKTKSIKVREENLLRIKKYQERIKSGLDPKNRFLLLNRLSLTKEYQPKSLLRSIPYRIKVFLALLKSSI
jgi:GT2 family glycosyltransferase